MTRSQARSTEQIDFDREQRRTANEFADTVWRWVRNRKCCGQKFRREVPIPPYTVDFCCIELQLVIEVDGEPHRTPEGIRHDQQPDRYLRDLGFGIFRIPGYNVIREDGDAASQIEQFVRQAIEAQPLTQAQPLTPNPSPRVQGEGS